MKQTLIELLVQQLTRQEEEDQIVFPEMVHRVQFEGLARNDTMEKPRHIMPLMVTMSNM